MSSPRVFAPGLFQGSVFQGDRYQSGIFRPGLFQRSVFQLATSPRIPIREACLRAIAARLELYLPWVPLERNRRRPIGGGDSLPCLVLRDAGHLPSADLGAEEQVYTLSAELEGYASAEAEEDLGPALTALHADVAAVLFGVEIPIGTAGRSIWPVEESFEIDLLGVEDSEVPIGVFFLGLKFDATFPVALGPYTT